MSKKKCPSTLTEHNTRHTILIKIQENVKTEFPDAGGALVSVEHTRKIHGDPEDTDVVDSVDVSDLLNVAMNLIASTIIESDVSDDSKLTIALRISQDIIGQVLSQVLPGTECIDPEDVDLTPEQKASMQLFLSNPLVKPTLN